MKSTATPVLHAGLAVLLGSLALSVVPSGLKVGNGVKRSAESISEVLSQLTKGHARAVKRTLHSSSDSNRHLMASMANQAILARRPKLFSDRKAA